VEQRDSERRVALSGLREATCNARGDRMSRLLDGEGDVRVDAAQSPARPVQLGSCDGGRVLEQRIRAHRLATAGTALASLLATGARRGRSATN
jgi:hypothetical protein